MSRLSRGVESSVRTSRDHIGQATLVPFQRTGTNNNASGGDKLTL